MVSQITMAKPRQVIPQWAIRSLQWIILIAPLPFGFSSPWLSPLFFLLLATWMVAVRPWATALPAIPGYSWLLRFATMGVGLIFFQLIPLPRAWLEVISPATLNVLDSLPMAPIKWHGISLVPGHTVMAAMSVMVVVIFFFTLLKMPFSLGTVRRIAFAVGVSGVVQVVIGGGRMLLPGDRFFWFFYPVESPLTRELMMGTFATHTQAALFLSMGIMVMAGVLAADAGIFGPRGTGPSNGRDWIGILKEKRWSVIGLAICITGFALTRCAGGRWIMIFATVIFLLAWVYIKFPSHQRRWLRWVVLTAIIFTAMAAIQRARPQLHTAATGQKTFVGYTEPMKNMTSDFAFLGTGAGSFGALYPLYDETLRVHMTHAPNDWRQMVIETGYLGMLILILFMLLYARGVLLLWDGRRNPRVRAMGAGWVIAAVLTPGFAFFHYPFRVPGLLFFAALMLGMAVRAMARSGEENSRAF